MAEAEGAEKHSGSHIKIPGSGRGKTAAQKIRDRESLFRRTSLEPIIGHLERDHRMLKNNLKGIKGDVINTLLADAEFNMMKVLRKIRKPVIIILYEFFENLTIKYLAILNYY